MRTPFATYFMTNIPRDAAGAGAGNDGGGAGVGAGAGAAQGGAGAGGGAGGGGQQQGPWYASSDYGFDDDTRKFFEGKNYPDVKTALSSLRHADQVARDRNVLQKPDPAKINEWDGWKDLGWTPEIGDYKVAKPQLKSGQVLDEEMFSSFTKDAHELRIPLAAAQELFNRQFGKAYERIDAATAAGAAARTDLETRLKGDWGDKYDANVELSKRAMRALGVGMDDSAEIERMLGSPRLVKLFHGFAERIGEDNLVTPNSPSGASEHPATIEAELTRFEQDEKNIKIMQDQRNPLYQQTVDQRRKLIQRLAVAQAAAGGRK